MSATPPAARRAIARSTALTAILSALWLIVVYATQVLLAAWFGAGKEMDAYLAATSVPFFLATLLLEALHLAFVPVFIEHRARGETAAAQQMVGAILFALVLGLGVVSVAGVLISPFLIRVLAPGFDPERLTLATGMSRIIFPSVLFLTVAGFLNSLHYAHKRFLVPALSPLLSASVNLAIIAALAPRIGITSSALGTLFGSLAQCLLALPLLREHGIRLNISNLRNTALAEVARLAGWRIAGDLLGKATPVVDRWLASGLAVGSISYLGYATRIIEFALGLIGRSINAVLFPLLAERAADEDIASLSRAVSVGMRMTALVALPISAIVLVLREPVVRVLFQRNAFDAAATQGVSLVLVGYVGIFAANALGGQIVQTLYALKQSRAIAAISIIGSLGYIVGAITLTPRWGVLGLAVALSLNYLFNLLAYAFLLFRKLRAQWDPNVTRFYWTASAAAILAGATASSVYGALGAPDFVTDQIIALGTAVGMALGLYTSILLVMRAPEIPMLWSALTRRVVEKDA